MATIERPASASSSLRQRHAATAAAPSHTTAATQSASAGTPASSVASHVASPEPSGLELASPSAASSPSQAPAASSLDNELARLRLHPIPSSTHWPDLSRDDYLVRGDESYGTEEEASFAGGLEPSAPSFRLLESSPGLQLQPSGPSLSGQPLLASQRQPANPMASSIAQPAPAAAASSSSNSKPLVNASGQPLSPRAAARLAELRARAQMAEVREQALEEAVRRGEVALPERQPVKIIQHRVAPGDDLTDLAVRYGSSVASIMAANRRIVWEQTLDNVNGELIDIPATRDAGPLAQKDPAAEAEKAKRNQQFFAIRSFREKTRCTESEATFYLDENDYDVSRALDQWRDDAEWEATQKADAKADAKGSKGKAREMQPLIYPTSGPHSSKAASSIRL